MADNIELNYDFGLLADNSKRYALSYIHNCRVIKDLLESYLLLWRMLLALSKRYEKYWFVCCTFIIGIMQSDVSSHQTPNREFLLRVSYLEIYNEVCFFLICSLFLVTLCSCWCGLLQTWKEIWLLLLCSWHCYSQNFLLGG